MGEVGLRPRRFTENTWDKALTKAEWRDVFKNISFVQGAACKTANQISNNSRITYVYSSVLDNRNKFVNTVAWCPFNLAIRQIEDGGQCKFMSLIYIKSILVLKTFSSL